MLVQDRDRLAREPAYLYILREEFAQRGTTTVQELCPILSRSTMPHAMPQYFVTFDIEAADPLLPVAQLARVIREMILPSIEALADLTDRGKVVTGGYPIGDRFMVFIVEADSEEEVHEVIKGLPLSSEARTKVRRMQSFEELLRDTDEAPDS